MSNQAAIQKPLPSGRGEVTVIDVHTHIVPENFPAAPSPSCAGRWPAMAHRAGAQAAVMIGGKEFRLVDHRCWDCARRVSDMEAGEIAMQVLSPMPELLSYWLEPSEACTMARHINGAIAELIAASPGRFAGLGMVPLQVPELAAKELASMRDEYGFAGVEIGSNINGKVPGDASFDPFWAEAERLDLAVFVHALHPVATDRMIGPPMLPTYIGFPIDTGLAAASLITSGVLKKFPRLRIAFSHGGGILAAILPRLANGWRTVPALSQAFEDPQATARRFYYDNLVFDHATVRHLMTLFGVSQIFVGSDYPFAAGQPDPARFTAELGLEAADWAAMSAGNAKRFLGL
jgi:aminocarboxymuconate-semialdehyde decarboxylase